ncbi:ATP-binding protein [Thermoactinomyces sp. DSM 45892]|uniref:ATP-binding protein n=1 Tax=Thermoactinomyces sp. DSM 45892 TaxID=1882753 RepID=UPI0008958DA0|nr:ATP-binding protein [Thermoactinomyces sp. DSM 45892]SDY70980.1 AAA domain-containing protein [Thermoactinomyces sp. DSM 45892]
MLLPTEKTQPKQKLEDYSILLYGQPKIGKSTFCSRMDNPLFLATEPGLEALSCYEVKVPDWQTFIRVCGELSKGNHPFKTIVIDTVDNLWKCCAEFIKEKQGIQHESDLGFGKGWQLIKDEFFRVIRKLSLLPYGLVFTSHVESYEVKTRVSTINKAVPSIPRSGRDIVLGMVDIILYAESVRTNEGSIRVIRTQPDESWEAGDRTEHAFGRKLPSTLPLSFKKFEQAFYNQPEEETAGGTDDVDEPAEG